MRVNSVELAWFRGAAAPIELKLASKSMVVYGANGSGKSSFVDGVEYLISDGKIGHLAHEYSGRRQEKAVPNTHTPEHERTTVSLALLDDSTVLAVIAQDGTRLIEGEGQSEVGAWDYRRTVLRQGEVSDFIMGTKGEKYSALLPLLGLDTLEIAAENLRQLAKTIEEVSRLQSMRDVLQATKAKRVATFGDDSDADILHVIRELHAEHCSGAAGNDALTCCNELKEAIDERIASSSAEERRHVALQDATKSDLKKRVEEVRKATQKLNASLEPLIAERIEVLEAALAFARRLDVQTVTVCPACGRSIPVEHFRQHIEEERGRLAAVVEAFRTRKVAVAALCDAVSSLKIATDKPELDSWRKELEAAAVGDLSYLGALQVEALRASCEEDDLRALDEKICPVWDAAASTAAKGPSSAQQLTKERSKADVGAEVVASIDRLEAVRRTESLVAFVKSLEESVRDELRQRALSIIGEISQDVQDMWAVLHPDEPIDDVRLYIPEDADKAIDIGLRFHGVSQDSPRLTLSEGHRNSLGLCIFLAMAKREDAHDGPIFLDDVVISVDRGHRGMIVSLLNEQFADRQVVVFTHDRDWYSELRHQLDESAWRFQVLLPYEKPTIGIRWSHSVSTFDDARSHLDSRPDSAANDARKIMDVELALVAEHVRLKMPFLRAEKNDKRLSHDFLERLVAAGRRCLEERREGGYIVNEDAIHLLEAADTLLVSWGNRGSHTFDVEPAEALQLIDACEQALECFTCPDCGRRIWFADASSQGLLMCECGRLRWRYGKG